MFVYFDLSIFCFHFKKYSFGNHSVTKKKKEKKFKTFCVQDMFMQWAEHFEKEN